MKKYASKMHPRDLTAAGWISSKVLLDKQRGVEISESQGAIHGECRCYSSTANTEQKERVWPFTYVEINCFIFCSSFLFLSRGPRGLRVIIKIK